MKGNWVTGAAIQRAVKAGNLILQRARQVVDFAVGHLLRRLPCGHATADDRVYDLVGSLETMRMQTGMSTLNSRTTLPTGKGFGNGAFTGGLGGLLPGDLAAAAGTPANFGKVGDSGESCLTLR